MPVQLAEMGWDLQSMLLSLLVQLLQGGLSSYIRDVVTHPSKMSDGRDCVWTPETTTETVLWCLTIQSWSTLNASKWVALSMGNPYWMEEMVVQVSDHENMWHSVNTDRVSKREGEDYIMLSSLWWMHWNLTSFTFWYIYLMCQSGNFSIAVHFSFLQVIHLWVFHTVFGFPE